MNFDQFKNKLEEDYKERMRTYKEHVDKLNAEKETFRKQYPDDPYLDIMFLNVIAPPQRLEIIEIV